MRLVRGRHFFWSEEVKGTFPMQSPAKKWGDTSPSSHTDQCPCMLNDITYIDAAMVYHAQEVFVIC